MLVQILMISSLITAILTGISLAREYRIGMNELEESFELIKKTKLSSLAEATWSFNQEQSISQIKGILQQQEMVEVDLIDESGESIFKVQKDDASKMNTIEQTFPLTHQRHNNRIESVGSLRVVASKDFLHRKIISRIVYVASSQGFKTLIVSFVILLIFQQYIIGRIDTLNSYFERASKLHPPPELKLANEYNHEDEFNQLEANINKMVQKLKRVHQDTAEQLHVKNKDIQKKEKETQTLLSSKEKLLQEVTTKGSELSATKEDLKQMLQRFNSVSFLHDFSSTLGSQTNSLSVSIHTIENKNENYMRSMQNLLKKLKDQKLSEISAKSPEEIISDLIQNEIKQRHELTQDLKDLQSELKFINENVFSINTPLSQSLDLQKTPLTPLLENVVEEFQAEQDNCFFTIEMNTDEYVKVDRLILTAIFRHIFRHSSSAYENEEEVQIYLGTELRENGIEIIVKDFGTKFSVEELKNELLTQGSRFPDLDFAAKNISLFQGQLTITENEPDGSTISIIIPIASR